MNPDPRADLVVQTCFYGLGAFVPVIVLGPAARWRQLALARRPEPEPHLPDRWLLALRWCGPDEEEDGAPALLTAAAARAPAPTAAPDRITEFEQTLPAHHLRLIRVAPGDLIGLWAQRPGHTTTGTLPEETTTP